MRPNNIGFATGRSGLFATRLVAEWGRFATKPPRDKLKTAVLYTDGHDKFATGGTAITRVWHIHVTSELWTCCPLAWLADYEVPVDDISPSILHVGYKLGPETRDARKPLLLNQKPPTYSRGAKRLP